MSGYLAGKVWRSDLAKELKPLAACLADMGNDDGDGIYPSVAYLEWLLGWSERTIRSGMAALRAMDALVAVQNEKGGRGKVPTYRLDVDKLPTRPVWKKGATNNPLSVKGAEQSMLSGDLKGAIHDSKGCNLEHRNKEESLVEPLVDPPERVAVEPVYEPVDDQRAGIPDWVPLSTWQEFVKMRKKMREPFTDHARFLALKELAKLMADGNEPGEVLNQSILNGWKGLFPLGRNRGNGNGRTPNTTSLQEHYEGTAEILRRTRTVNPPKDRVDV